MESAVVKRKPQIRAAGRDGVNRFQLVGKMEAKGDKHEGTIQLKRLALISRAHLASVRRNARGIKFERQDFKWRLLLDFRIGAPKVEFPTSKAEMREVAKLLGVPIRLAFGFNLLSFAEWRELEQLGTLVNGLAFMHVPEPPAFAEFVERVASHLKQLEWPSYALAHFPPLDLEKLVLVDKEVNYAHLGRHKIRRLDVRIDEIHRRFTSGQVISASITSLGLNGSDATNFRHELIEAFCCRFSALEELHISIKYSGVRNVLGGDFKGLWENCLELRDQLDVPRLKRFFFVLEHDCTFRGNKTEWIDKLKQVEPFNKATFTVDRSSSLVRMFLKHSRPRDAKPIFFHIDSCFRWLGN
ncbi:hypothetical protein M3Y99_00229500 [Aphelenchoides fujianensis]|nr:hypothetical protein M3Y99_00229500 [Aphelenchoides fujianensis]